MTRVVAFSSTISAGPSSILPPAAGEYPADGDRVPVALAGGRRSGQHRIAAGRDGLQAERADDALSLLRETELAPMESVERRGDPVFVAERHLQRRIRTGVPHQQAAVVRDSARLGSLGDQRIQRRVLQRDKTVRRRSQRLRRQGLLQRLLRQVAQVGEALAECRQHAGQRMDQHRSDPERLRHFAGVLTARAAEAAQREIRDVITLLHGDLLDGLRHALDRDSQAA